MSKEEIKQSAVDGEICEIYGHRWCNITPNIMYPTNPPQYPVQQRKCDICGKNQVQKPAKWEDVN